MIRKAISLASVTLDVNVYEAPPKPPSTATDVVTHIDIEQSASGLSSTHELRCVDDLFREHSDWLFGNLKGKTKWVSLDEVEDDFLKSGWELEGAGGKDFLRSHVENEENGWQAYQIWGFQTVDGERRYCRNVLVTKGENRVTIRMVYDYEG